MPISNNALAAAFLSQAQQSNQLANPRRNLMQTQMMARPGQAPLRQQYPTTYGALAGLVGMDPNEMGGSVFDPNTAAVRQGAGYTYLPGLVASAIPLGKVGTGIGMLAGMAKSAGRAGEALAAGKAAMPSMSSEASMLQRFVEEKVTAAQTKLMKSKDFAGLKGQERDHALEAVRAKIEKTGVQRSMANLLDAVNGEEDIARSLMQNPAFKINGVVPKSVIDDAVSTRARMRSEPASTPGAKASEEDWKKL